MNILKLVIQILYTNNYVQTKGQKLVEINRSQKQQLIKLHRKQTAAKPAAI